MLLDSGGLLPSEKTNISSTATQDALIIILSINDVYEMYPDQQGRGGIAELATLLERERASIPSHATVFVTLNGDFLSGSEVGEKHKGAHMIALMNHLKIDYVVLGNHEFDFGASILQQRIQESHFKWLGANVKSIVPNSDQSPILLPNVVEYELIPLANGLKVGLFGVCTQDTPQLSFPGPTIVFEDVITTSQRCVETLQSQGADFIIALTHLSMNNDKILARKVSGIDVQLGGHDHEPMTHHEGKTLIHKSGQNAIWLSRLEFQLSKPKIHSELEGVLPLRVYAQWSMLANVHIPPQPAAQALVHQYMATILDSEEAERAQHVLATLALPVYTKTVWMRSRECNMGNIAADALRSELHGDFGLLNGGFIRGDTVYEALSTITVAMINHEMPFPRPAVLVRIQAQDFAEAILQHASKYPQLSGSFPHLSGCRVTIDRTGGTPRLTRFHDANGHEIDRNEMVTVATTAFIAGGGDGCTAWLRGTIIHESDKVTVVVSNYLMKQRVLSYPLQEGRVMIIE